MEVAESGTATTKIRTLETDLCKIYGAEAARRTNACSTGILSATQSSEPDNDENIILFIEAATNCKTLEPGNSDTHSFWFATVRRGEGNNSSENFQLALVYTSERKPTEPDHQRVMRHDGQEACNAALILGP